MHPMQHNMNKCKIQNTDEETTEQILFRNPGTTRLVHSLFTRAAVVSSYSQHPRSLLSLRAKYRRFKIYMSSVATQLFTSTGQFQSIRFRGVRRLPRIEQCNGHTICPTNRVRGNAPHRKQRSIVHFTSTFVRKCYNFFTAAAPQSTEKFHTLNISKGTPKTKSGNYTSNIERRKTPAIGNWSFRAVIASGVGVCTTGVYNRPFYPIALLVHHTHTRVASAARVHHFDREMSPLRPTATLSSMQYFSADNKEEGRRPFP